ncbi:MAG: hypothetical protein A3J79_12185 [Elusimicrobia bacterium RIFOXYB2_FULL_62_6]|nr:MAG: hypothetical protein A3J79_12185 [Elusimicrobia bacterium RIFOXYB2_FULL_62_6]
MKKTFFAAIWAASLFLFTSVNAASPYKITVLGDLHLTPERPQTVKVIRDINSWPDVNLVALVGDIVEKRGSEQEYGYAAKVLGKLKKPYCAVTGNHEYLYNDKRVNGTGYATKKEREYKLEVFKKNFISGNAAKPLYYSMMAHPYLLIFLSCDDVTRGPLTEDGRLESDYLTEMSKDERDWFADELNKHKGVPTIVFFHAPLPGDGGSTKTEHVAQPLGKILKILAHNPQVMLWVSGHTHVHPANAIFTTKRKVVNNVINIHNTDFVNPHDYITKTLLLASDGVVVSMYNHTAGAPFKTAQTFPIPKGLPDPEY